MISMIVPTRNRAHTLALVLDSYLEQDLVDELIFVSDAGDDDTPALIEAAAARTPAKRVVLVRNAERLGASRSRNVGVAKARNEFILFCDDDEYLEAGYARICMNKLTASNAGAVSGRRVYMLGEETPVEALARFGHGMRRAPPFRHLLCEIVNGARFDGDVELPFTNAIILTRRSLLLAYPFDAHYARGNGYREESDFQMNLFVNGYTIIMTNECHSIHLPLNAIRRGGQHTQPWRRVYWSVYYTGYFFKKYYARYAKRIGMRAPRWLALIGFSLFALYRETLRPPLYRTWTWMQKN